MRKLHMILFIFLSEKKILEAKRLQESSLVFGIGPAASFQSRSTSMSKKKNQQNQKHLPHRPLKPKQPHTEGAPDDRNPQAQYEDKDES